MRQSNKINVFVIFFIYPIFVVILRRKLCWDDSYFVEFVQFCMIRHVMITCVLRWFGRVYEGSLGVAMVVVMWAELKGSVPMRADNKNSIRCHSYRSEYRNKTCVGTYGISSISHGPKMARVCRYVATTQRNSTLPNLTRKISYRYDCSHIQIKILIKIYSEMMYYLVIFFGRFIS